MENRFCGQCGRPLGKQDVKPSWGFVWGFMWRGGIIYLAFSLVVGLLALVIYLS